MQAPPGPAGVGSGWNWQGSQLLLRTFACTCCVQTWLPSYHSLEPFEPFLTAPASARTQPHCTRQCHLWLVLVARLMYYKPTALLSTLSRFVTQATSNQLVPSCTTTLPGGTGRVAGAGGLGAAALLATGLLPAVTGTGCWCTFACVHVVLWQKVARLPCAPHVLPCHTSVPVTSVMCETYLT